MLDTCERTGKVKHKTFKLAKDSARRMKERHNEPVTPYYCPHCHGYHVGHTPFNKQKRAKLYHQTGKLMRYRKKHNVF